jgi:hypothetical protein
MNRTKGLKTFIVKTILMLVLLGLPIYLLGLIPGMQALSDPRKFLFVQKDFSNFNYAIMGDSVFCSYRVDSIDDTMWKKFEKMTGQQCFPAALNGATIADMVDESKYLATRMSEGSTVFVGLIPSRFVGKGIVRHRNYFNDFEQLRSNGNASSFKVASTKLIDFIFSDFLLYREPYSLEKFLRKKKGTFDIGHVVWSRAKSDHANKHYRIFVENQKRLKTYIDYVALEQILENFNTNSIHVVFVLSGLNHGLINEFSDQAEATELIAKFRNARDSLVDYFDRSNSDYIDLFDSIKSECFADLVHLNTCGDEATAQAFADYVLHDRKDE